MQMRSMTKKITIQFNKQNQQQQSVASNVSTTPAIASITATLSTTTLPAFEKMGLTFGKIWGTLKSFLDVIGGIYAIYQFVNTQILKCLWSTGHKN